MIYVQLIDRNTVKAWEPPVLVTEGRTYVHPTPDVLREAGYLPLSEEIAQPGARRVYTRENGCVVAHAVYGENGEAQP